MDGFSNDREALDYVASQIADEAQREGAQLSEVERKMLYSPALLCCGLAVAWHSPLAADGTFCAVERFGARFANRRGLTLVSVAAAAIVVRLVLLAWIPVPVPRIHDEFSYLLAGDTFAHGRLTNPPHPLWIFFDTFHVNQYPTYIVVVDPLLIPFAHEATGGISESFVKTLFLRGYTVRLIKFRSVLRQ